LIFLHDIVSLKPTIVLIISHFLTSVKFCRSIKIQNSVEKGKFRGSAQNSPAREKLWILIMTESVGCFYDFVIATALFLRLLHYMVTRQHFQNYMGV